MNQIICTPTREVHTSTIDVKKNLILKKRKIFKKFFYLLLFISISLSIYYIFYRYDLYKSEKISQKLLDDFSVTSLYSTNSDYIINPLISDFTFENYDNVQGSIIGIIEIKKLNIVYPVLSEINKDLLKISPCRFYGPNPNEIGNLCIAAHNYKNGTFFSNLSDLVNGDIITIYDSNKKYHDYIVYAVYTTDYKDIECMSQKTNNKKIITLVTCNTFDNHYRTIVKAKEI